MHLVDADSSVTGVGESAVTGKSNYFPTGDPKTWITNVPNYSRVRYKQLYPGVDALFYGSANRLEYDFELQAGVDPEKLRTSFAGTKKPRVDASGNLLLPSFEI